MNIRTSAVAALAVLSVACTVPRSNGQTSPESVVVSHRAEAPVFVNWVVQGADEHSVALTARIDRRAPMSIPLSVTVVPPPSLKLVSGELSFVLEPSASAGLVERPFSFSFDRIPAEDLRLVADAQSAGFGVHAEDAYRFGRPVPGAIVPATSGPAVKVGDHDFGQGVPLK